MSIDMIRQNWTAVYNDRLQRANQAQDPALRAHFQAEVNLIQKTLQALQTGADAVPPPASPPPGASPMSPPPGANPMSNLPGASPMGVDNPKDDPDLGPLAELLGGDSKTGSILDADPKPDSLPDFGPKNVGSQKPLPNMGPLAELMGGGPGPSRSSSAGPLLEMLGGGAGKDTGAAGARMPDEAPDSASPKGTGGKKDNAGMDFLSMLLGGLLGGKGSKKGSGSNGSGGA